MAGHFRALRNHATKIYKFRQGRSIFALFGVVPDPTYAIIKDGVCASLTVDWLAEKLNRPWTLQFSGDFAGPTVHARRNADTVERNVQRHVTYAGRGQHADAWLLRNAGLRTYSVHVPIFGHTMPFGRKIDGLVQLMKKGRGAYISATARGHGHALGLYRSRGAHLYFFDANCGVYQVPAPSVEAFFDALATCYANLDARLDYRDITFVYT